MKLTKFNEVENSVSKYCLNLDSNNIQPLKVYHLNVKSYCYKSRTATDCIILTTDYDFNIWTDLYKKVINYKLQQSGTSGI